MPATVGTGNRFNPKTKELRQFAMPGRQGFGGVVVNGSK
jgi:hypothetical protein